MMTLRELIAACPGVLDAHVFLHDPMELDDWHSAHVVLSHKGMDPPSVVPEVRAILDAADLAR